MYAVIKTGGKQYRVSIGDKLKVETLNAEAGENIELTDVLMISDGDTANIGTPTLEGAAVAAEVVSHGRHKKVEIVKFKRRKHHQKRTGHRQNYTEIQITNISASGATTTATQKTEAAKSATNDDLKKLAGVGPKLAEQLNAIGICSYQQVAALTEAECADVKEKIDFKGAVKWDEIIASAKELTH